MAAPTDVAASVALANVYKGGYQTHQMGVSGPDASLAMANVPTAMSTADTNPTQVPPGGFV
jgi:hypothetical protein